MFIECSRFIITEHLSRLLNLKHVSRLQIWETCIQKTYMF